MDKNMIKPGMIVEHFKRDFIQGILSIEDYERIELFINDLQVMLDTGICTSEEEKALREQIEYRRNLLVSAHPQLYRYRIIGIAIETESEEECVVYQALYPDNSWNYRIFTRTIDSFCRSVDHGKYPQSKRDDVFVFLSNEKNECTITDGITACGYDFGMDTEYAIYCPICGNPLTGGENE